MPTLPVVNNVVSLLRTPLKKPANSIRVSPQLVEPARAEVPDVLRSLDSTPQGLRGAEAEARREKYGPNEVAQVWFIRLAGGVVVCLSAVLLFVHEPEF
jgi:hypothetical protein